LGDEAPRAVGVEEEPMNFLIAHALTIAAYGIAAVIPVFFILMLLILWRQRGTRKRLAVLGMSLRGALSQSAEERKAESEKNLAKIKEALGVLSPVMDHLNIIKRRLDSLETLSRDSQKSFQDSILEIGFSVATLERMESGVATLGKRLDQVYEEVAKSHQWLEDVRILERVVTNLIGAEKMRALIEKERNANNPQATPMTPQKKSLL
jgi:hypothetical protein